MLLTRKHACVDQYEYLEVLSLTQWKQGATIKTELEKLKGGYLTMLEIYVNLSKLEDGGLIERRNILYEEIMGMTVGPIPEFRKKPGGRRAPPEKREAISFAPI